MLVTTGPLPARPTDAPPPLPPPTGAVVRVRTEPELQAAVKRVSDNTTILIAPGTYQLTETLYIRGVSGVALRGESPDRDAVVLVGQGMANADYGKVPFGIWAGDGAHGLLVANLTARDFYFHPVILNAHASRAHLYNVHLVDAGQQFLKSNPDEAGRGNDFGVVEYSVFEFTATGRDDYPKAIDVHGGRGWTIRDNLFRNIRAPQGMVSSPAVLIWRGSRDTVIEGNTFLNCQREIVLGAEDINPPGHDGGVVRNNFVYRDRSRPGDAAISVWGSAGTEVLHNTVLLSGTYPTAIEYRFPGATGVLIANNLTDAAIISRDKASAMVVGNVTDATADLFVDPAAGNLHLRVGSVTSRLAGTRLNGQSLADWDGQRRPVTGLIVGADQP